MPTSDFPGLYRVDGHTIYKHKLLDLFQEIRKGRPYLYALLRRMPKRLFCIFNDDDDRNMRESLTLDEFYALFDLFHPRLSRFSVEYRTYYFRNEWLILHPDMDRYDYKFSGEVFECWSDAMKVRHFDGGLDRLLNYWLWESMLGNKPFHLTEATIAEYGFTDEDVDMLRCIVEEKNRHLAEELREDWCKLTSIDYLFDPEQSYDNATLFELIDNAVLDTPGRLRQIIRSRKMSVAAFAREIGLARAEPIYRILQGRAPLSSEIARKISDTYPRLPLEWILTGTKPAGW